MQPLPATHSLQSLLQQRISSHGPVDFPTFMTACLYEPSLGYYARENHQVGRSGDFFTSVSVGPLFGQLLARRFIRAWQDLGKPSRWRVIESGAHDGTLALDILTETHQLNPQAASALEYVIPEPLPAFQARQHATLRDFTNQVRFLTHPSELDGPPLPGIAFGNEVLDALPFHLVERREGHWVEKCITASGNEPFQWCSREITNPLLLAALLPLGNDFPDGYLTEVRTCFRNFLEPLARALESPRMIWIDYGFTRTDYYHPDRQTGTFRTFSHHRAGENPLADPGGCDITAHVDFTALANAASSIGLGSAKLTTQASWLTTIARDWLLQQENTPKPGLLRQFQTLTHPAHLGTKFHVLELETPHTQPNASPAR